MSRRKIHQDAVAALAIRRLQEQAALIALQQKQASEVEARTALEELCEAHRDSEAAWAAAASHSTLDIDSVRLWQAHTGLARDRMAAAEETVSERAEAVTAQRTVWADHLALTEAVERVSASAARAVRRADDDRRLMAAEDAHLSRRPAS